MNTHRDNLMPAIKELLHTDIAGKKILELGQGLDTDFKELFESLGLIYTASDNCIGINNAEYNEITEQIRPAKLSGEQYYYDSMEDLKSFSDESFDIIFSCHAFEHCENPLKAIREALRVLKKGGKYIVATPWCCKHHIIDSDMDHIFVLNQYQMMRLLHYAGFNLIDVIEQRNIAWKEQDFNLISVGVK